MPAFKAMEATWCLGTNTELEMTVRTLQIFHLALIIFDFLNRFRQKLYRYVALSVADLPFLFLATICMQASLKSRMGIVPVLFVLLLLIFISQWNR